MVGSRWDVCMAIILMLSSSAATVIMASDSDPLQDFCVAAAAASVSSESSSSSKKKPTSSAIAINGLPCRNPNSITAADFKSSILKGPTAAAGSTSSTKIDGVLVTAATGTSFPALNTQGLSFTRVDYEADGLLPPHVHPRASETLFVVSGTLLAGFIDTANTHFSTTLEPGDLFLFPLGLVHYVLNVGHSPALSLSGLNSQNPGASLLPQALFTTSPPLHDDILEKAFSLSPHQVEQLKATIGRGTQV